MLTGRRALSARKDSLPAPHATGAATRRAVKAWASAASDHAATATHRVRIVRARAVPVATDPSGRAKVAPVVIGPSGHARAVPVAIGPSGRARAVPVVTYF